MKNKNTTDFLLKQCLGQETISFYVYIHIPPKNLATGEETNEIFEILEKEIGQYSRLGDIIMGDLNAKTGLLKEKYYDDFEENHANCNNIEGHQHSL